VISVVDYGVGNLQNICNAFDFLQKKSKIVQSPKELAKAEKIILPGVGSFGYCVQKIKEYQFVDTLLEKVEDGTPLLGICVGMQLFFEESKEQGRHQGLGILKGEVRRLQTKYKVPQIGWNKVFFPKTKKQEWFYFVHSYHTIPEDESIITGYADYGTRVVSTICKNNIWGTQFHPEKSQAAGLNLLKEFAKL
jgi:glutamine amidotransferase